MGQQWRPLECQLAVVCWSSSSKAVGKAAGEAAVETAGRAAAAAAAAHKVHSPLELFVSHKRRQLALQPLHKARVLLRRRQQQAAVSGSPVAQGDYQAGRGRRGKV